MGTIPIPYLLERNQNLSTWISDLPSNTFGKNHCKRKTSELRELIVIKIYRVLIRKRDFGYSLLFESSDIRCHYGALMSVLALPEISFFSRET